MREFIVKREPVVALADLRDILADVAYFIELRAKEAGVTVAIVQVGSPENPESLAAMIDHTLLRADDYRYMIEDSGCTAIVWSPSTVVPERRTSQPRDTWNSTTANSSAHPTCSEGTAANGFTKGRSDCAW
mgnify:CR=1 FL=1